jgi:hypothetical protein
MDNLSQITLARAFKFRSQLKRKLTELQSKYYTVEKTWEKGLRPHFDVGESPEEISQAILDTQTFIFELSIAINKANQEKLQEYLIGVNHLNETIRHLTKVQEDMNVRLKPTKEINPVSGVETITEYEIAKIHPNIKEALKNAKYDKSAWEDEISSLNATTTITVTPELLEKIKNIEI